MNSVLWWVVQNTLTVAALLPVVWLACRALRTRPAAQHLLWLLLMVKLVAPPIVDWPWELAQDWQASTSTPSVIDVPPPTMIDDAVEIDWIDATNEEMFAFDAIDTFDTTTVEAAPTKLILDAPPPWNTERYLLAAWALGAATILTFVARGLFVQNRVLRAARRPSRLLTEALQLVATRMRMRAPGTAVSHALESPVVACLPRPRLIWPAALDEPEAIAASDGILAHELAHIARRDHWIVCLETLILACQWWNPLAWYLRRRLRETRELACDALALAHAGQSRGDYARRLLALSVGHDAPLTLAPAFGARSFSRRFLQRRLTMVFDSQTHGRVSRGGAVAAALLAAVALPGFANAFQADNAPVAANNVATTTATVADAPPAPDGSSAAARVTSQASVPVLGEIPVLGRLYDVTNAESADNIATAAAPVTTTSADAAPVPVDSANGSNLTLDRLANVATDPTQPATAVIVGRGDNARHTMMVQHGAKLEVFQRDDSYLGVTITKADGTREVYSFKVRADAANGAGAKSFEPVASYIEADNVPAKPVAPQAILDRYNGAVADPAAMAAVDYYVSSVQNRAATSADVAGSADIEMLQSDVELAEITREEKAMELEIAEQLTSGAFGGASRETIGKVQLAKIGLRRADVELKRCQLKLNRARAACERDQSGQNKPVAK